MDQHGVERREVPHFDNEREQRFVGVIGLIQLGLSKQMIEQRPR